RRRSTSIPARSPSKTSRVRFRSRPRNANRTGQSAALGHFGVPSLRETASETAPNVGAVWGHGPKRRVGEEGPAFRPSRARSLRLFSEARFLLSVLRCPLTGV